MSFVQTIEFQAAEFAYQSVIGFQRGKTHAFVAIQRKIQSIQVGPGMLLLGYSGEASANGMPASAVTEWKSSGPKHGSCRHAACPKVSSALAHEMPTTAHNAHTTHFDYQGV